MHARIFGFGLIRTLLHFAVVSLEHFSITASSQLVVASTKTNDLIQVSLLFSGGGIHNSAMAIIIAVHSPFEDSELVMPAFVTYFP